MSCESSLQANGTGAVSICVYDPPRRLPPRGSIDSPLFRVRVSKQGFNTLWVFSMSAYLRSLTCPYATWKWLPQ